jgi:uncharacterized repeat protein (TIGR03806 family)
MKNLLRIVCLPIIAMGMGALPAVAVDYPRDLLAWPVFQQTDSQLTLAEGTVPFAPLNPLFSDYASKFRTITIPDGQTIRLNAQGQLEYPVGTVLSKTFSYPQDQLSLAEGQALKALAWETGPQTAPLAGHHLVETRILTKTEAGWLGLPYVWNAEQTAATLKIIGVKRSYELSTAAGLRSFAYQVPNMNQCKGCHIRYEGFDKTVEPIGPKVANLNHEFAYPGGPVMNQLQRWQQLGLLADGVLPPPEPELVKWDDPAAALARRARSYLDINCAHCHNPKGPADTSSLHLGFEVTNPVKLGVCKSPVATGNGGIEDGFVITPGQPEQSILYRRLDSLNPAVMMPEIGRHLVHQEGLELIGAWIRNMNGDCQSGL